MRREKPRGTRRWCVAAGFLVGLSLCGCGGDGRGRAVYESEACPQCHGHDLRGGELGPPLRGLNSVWGPEELSQYIADPQSYLEHDERLRLIMERYPVPMPTLQMDKKRLADLVEYLLEQE